MKYDVVIVGAGMTGLSCAKVLSDSSQSVIVLESTDRPGGRIKTEIVNGFRMDHGFQVLQTGYPEASRMLDLDALALKTFPAGVAVRYNRKFHMVADPRRHPGLLRSTLFAPIGTLKDRYLMLKLAGGVCRGPIEKLFLEKEQPAIQFLQEWGFSSAFITRFFVPFFAGACLDPAITASSHVLRYIFRMFAQGDAALPSLGMEEIPKQLAAGLPPGSIRYESRVVEISNGCVTLEDGIKFCGRFVVLATSQQGLQGLLPNIEDQPSIGEYCFYYSADWLPPFDAPFLVLNGDGQGPVNNIAFPSLVAPEYCPSGKTLIAAVVLGKEHMGKPDLEQHVRSQCGEWFGRQADTWEHLHTFKIEHALPCQDPPTANPYDHPVCGDKQLLIAGEHGSLPGIQWALLSGRTTAEAILSSL